MCFVSDDQVLVQLAERVAAGSLVIARLHMPPAKAPPPGESTEDAATTAVAQNTASGAGGSHDAAVNQVVPSDKTEKHPFTLRLLDQELKAIEGVAVTFQIDGENETRVAVTNGSGEATITDGARPTATAKIKEIASVRKVIASRKTLAQKVPKPLPAHTRAEPLSDEMDEVPLTKGVRETLIVTRPAFRARFPGGHFETNKTFPKLGIVGALGSTLSHFHDTISKEPRELLVVGHTDTVGDKGYNLKLSLERARAVKECLEHDAKPWVRRFSKAEVGEVWGKPEIEHMLCALKRPLIDAESTSRDNGKIERLVRSYMALGGRASALEIVAHGCGESFPVEHDDEGENEEKENRRVELFFFAGPMAPEPPGETSEKGTPSYPAWQKQVVDAIELPPTSIKVRASLFFDGTMNNRANTMARLGDSKLDVADTSYENDYSNVSKLEETLRDQDGYDEPIKIYTEGIGTTNNDEDSPKIGGGLGAGPTGLVAKVHNAFIALVDRLLLLDARHIECLDLDVFGFSRGAAAARCFVHVALHGASWSERKGVFVMPLKSLKDTLEGEGYHVCKVNVRFVGLFDTVASYQYDHDDDTEQLHLDAIAVADRVVQLAASEEHRVNFRLTSIESAQAKGAGIELFLPGCHSDVGGGYRRGAVKTQLYDMDVAWRSKSDDERIEREKKWLIAMGWNTADELKETFTNEIIGSRADVKNDYDRIPLHLMARYAAEYKLDFSVKVSYPIPPDLHDARSQIDAYIQSLGTDPQSKIEDWFAYPEPPSPPPPWLTKLRHDYLHFSARYGTLLGAHAPNWEPDGKTGKRKRRINHG